MAGCKNSLQANGNGISLGDSHADAGGMRRFADKKGDVRFFRETDGTVRSVVGHRQGASVFFFCRIDPICHKQPGGKHESGDENIFSEGSVSSRRGNCQCLRFYDCFRNIYFNIGFYQL